MPDCLQPDWPAPARVKSLQTLRGGGFSAAPWASFNLGDHVGDDPQHVSANRDALTACLSAAPCWLQQAHGTFAVNAENSPKPVVADAAFTRRAGRVCVVMTADCLPVLFCDRVGSVVAAAHAGWRGLVGGVLESSLAAMAVVPDNVLAWLGPAIGPSAFEVGDEVRAAFVADMPAASAAFAPAGQGKWFADLYALARLRLARAGVTEVYGGNACTFSDPTSYFSYRRDGVTGRMATLIWLDEADSV